MFKILKNKNGLSLINLFFSATISAIILIEGCIYYFSVQNNIDNVNDSYLAYAIANSKYNELSKEDFSSISTKNSKNNVLANTPWKYDITVNNTPIKPSATSGSYKESKIDFYNEKDSKKSFSIYAETMNKDAGYIGNFGEYNGYVKLPSGLILQWGRVKIRVFLDSILTGEYVHIYFPQKILNAVASIGLQNASTGDAYTIYIQSVTEKEAIIVTDSSYYAYPSGYVYWQAIGY